MKWWKKWPFQIQSGQILVWNCNIAFTVTALFRPYHWSIAVSSNNIQWDIPFDWQQNFVDEWGSRCSFSLLMSCSQELITCRKVWTHPSNVFHFNDLVYWQKTHLQLLAHEGLALSMVSKSRHLHTRKDSMLVRSLSATKTTIQSQVLSIEISWDGSSFVGAMAFGDNLYLIEPHSFWCLVLSIVHAIWQKAV